MGSSITTALTGDMNSERMGTDNMPTVGKPPLDKPTMAAARPAQIR
jgi:hypothetical protein